MSSPQSINKKRNHRKRKYHASTRTHSDDDILDEIQDINFEELARTYPEFGQEWEELKRHKNKTSIKGSSFSSFVTNNFNRALTRAILHSRLNKLVLPNLPEGRLVPPVPNRLFYVRWIRYHLLPLLSDAKYFLLQPDTTMKSTAAAAATTTTTTTTAIAHSAKKSSCLCGIDIGTGASCIYPLLVCASCNTYRRDDSCNCQIVATDIDPISVESANKNVKANKLGNQIQVILVKPTHVQQEQEQQEEVLTQSERESESSKRLSSPSNDTTRNKGPIAHAMERIISNSNKKSHTTCTTTSTSTSLLCYDFVMTNPPFYDDNESSERTDVRAGDDRERVAMTAHEGSYPGGEVGFVLDMVRDSLRIRTGISWYTAMFGKKTSFVKVKSILSQLLGPGNLQVTEFGPGQMTRWFLAWTFHRPTSTNPSSKIVGGIQNFQVQHVEESATLDNDTIIRSEKDAVDEIVDRICTHCQTIIAQATVEYQDSIPTPTCKIDESKECYTKIITVQSPLTASSLETSSFPERIFYSVNTNDITEFKKILLKEIGDFRIDFTVSSMMRKNEASSPAETTGSTDTDDGHDNHRDRSSVVPSTGNFSVAVNLACYSHSMKGNEMIDKIRRQLVGEVSRTNRRWRRKLFKK